MRRGAQRAGRITATVGIVFVITAIPAAAAAPTSPLCEDGSWRGAHPLICDTGGPLPNIGGDGDGGTGADGGLVGRIVGVIGGLLGGGGLL